MTDDKPGLPPPIVRRSDEDLKRVRVTRSYEVITPLFGGGAEPQKADEVTVVRGSEVRAQLRFWWRAMRGGRFGGDLAKMKAHEDEIWGTAARPDLPQAPTARTGQTADRAARENPKRPPAVQLALTITNAGRPMTVTAKSGRRKGQQVNIGDPESPYSYVAFALREKQGKVIEGVKFDLNLTYAKAHADDVEAAIWGWETFGGIGARTRRGFGALACTNVSGARPATPESVEDWIFGQAQKYRATGTWHDSVPHPLYGQIRRVPQPFDDPMKAWVYLFSALREFRQYRIDKHTGKYSPYGRSVWPEPREIRRLASVKGGKVRGVPAAGKFPRAVFGMPILFQFKDEPIGPATLKPSSHDRLASPLILRPLKCANGACVALAVRLKTPELPPGSHLELDGHPVASQLSAADATAIPPLDTQTDVLGAFLAWLVKGKDR